MDVTAIASASTALTQAQVADAAQTDVLKTAIDLQAAGVVQLLEAVPQVEPAQPVENPPHLGNQVNTFA